MIFLTAIAFSASIFVFCILFVFIYSEHKHGKRFFAEKARQWLDLRVDILGKRVVTGWDHFVKYIVQLNWYYSIHSVLRTFLKIIVAFYTYFENIFERNRSRTKQLRLEKSQLGELNHLSQVAAHKKDTALTSRQKKQLRHKKLEEKH